MGQKKTAKKVGACAPGKRTRSRKLDPAPQSPERGPEKPETEEPKRPATPDELHEWIARELKVQVSREPLIQGHTAPFDYLVHTFFEGGSGPAAPDCILWANRGGGKTFLGAIATLLDLIYKPGIEVRVLAGSLDQSKRMLTHLQRFFAVPRLAARLAKRMTERRIVLTNGSAVEVLAASQTSIRGTRVQKLRCDEVDLFDPDMWDAAQLVTRSKVCGDVLVRGSVECLSTMHNPSGVMHRLVEEARAGKRRLFKWGVVDVLERCGEGHVCRAQDADCPLLPECEGRAKTLSRGHIPISDAIAMKGRVSLPVWQTEMLCLRPRRSNTVFPEFDRPTHVFTGPGPLSVRAWVAGMDFGYCAPTVVVWAAVDENDVLWIMDERFESGQLMASHVKAVRTGLRREGCEGWPLPQWIACDPAGNSRSSHSGESDTSLLRKAGLHVFTPHAEVGVGLGLIRRRMAPALGPPKLYVHARCRKLIESLERYRFDGNDQPIKGEWDHAVDALRYLVVRLDGGGGDRCGDYLRAG